MASFSIIVRCDNFTPDKIWHFPLFWSLIARILLGICNQMGPSSRAIKD